MKLFPFVCLSELREACCNFGAMGGTIGLRSSFNDLANRGKNRGHVRGGL